MCGVWVLCQARCMMRVCVLCCYFCFVQLVAIGTSKHSVLLLSTTTFETLFEAKAPHRDEVVSVALSHRSHYMATGNWRGVGELVFDGASKQGERVCVCVCVCVCVRVCVCVCAGWGKESVGKEEIKKDRRTHRHATKCDCMSRVQRQMRARVQPTSRRPRRFDVCVCECAYVCDCDRFGCLGFELWYSQATQRKAPAYLPVLLCLMVLLMACFCIQLLDQVRARVCLGLCPKRVRRRACLGEG